MLNPKTGQVFGWPAGGYPSPQGPFYCGVGSESVYGRNLAEAHMDACIKVCPHGAASPILKHLRNASSKAPTVCGSDASACHRFP